MEQSLSHGYVHGLYTRSVESDRFRVFEHYLPILGLVRAADLVSYIHWHASICNSITLSLR